MTQMLEVERELRAMILGLEIGPGERLTERWAEGRLGASRTPIRAALLHLEAEGLVSREGRGWIVTPINLAEIEQLFVYREVLEMGAMRLTMELPDRSGADRSVAAPIERLLDSCGPHASREESHRVGLEFHVELARLSGNDFLTRAVRDVMIRLSRARWLESNPEHHGWTEHRRILAAVRQGDKDAAVDLIGKHVRQSRERLLAILRDGRRSLRARGFVVTEG